MRPAAAAPAPQGDAANVMPEGARRSHALEHFTAALARPVFLQVLDLGGINQNNLDFVTGQGHRLYSEDLIRAAEAFFPPGTWDQLHPDERKLEEFLQQALPFPNGAAGAALVWDQLQFLPPVLAEAVAARLHRILAPDAPLLALFHADSALTRAAPSSCRILDERTLLLRPRGAPRRAHSFTPRTIERFFAQFHSIKFFMTRDNLQEVIVRR
jgi:hypothetical protein